LYFFGDNQGGAMSKYQKRQNLNEDQEIRVIKELITQPDRSVAIVGVSNLDRLLYFLLCDYCDTNRLKNIKEDLFENSNGALHSFSSKINILYVLGKISEDAYHDLHQLKGLRNDFAHYVDNHDFHSKDIADKCNKLRIKLNEKDKEFLSLLSLERVGPRRCFLESVLKLTSYLINIRSALWMAKALGGSLERPIANPD
jgi:hypothetical protein